jgi:hypothetical protein
MHRARKEECEKPSEKTHPQQDRRRKGSVHEPSQVHEAYCNEYGEGKYGDRMNVAPLTSIYQVGT